MFSRCADCGAEAVDELSTLLRQMIFGDAWADEEAGISVATAGFPPGVWGVDAAAELSLRPSRLWR
jgi:hypothetical protein